MPPDLFAGYAQGPGGYYKTADGSGPYSCSSAGVMTLITQVQASSGALPAAADRSNFIATGGTAQQLAAANAARVSLRGQNISAADLWINEMGTAAVIDSAGSYRVPTGGTFSINTNRAVSIIGATTGQKWTATET